MREKLRNWLEARRAKREGQQAATGTMQSRVAPVDQKTAESRPGPILRLIAWFTRAGDALGASRNAAFNWLLFVGAIVIAVAFVRETLSTAPIIHPVALPDALIKRGYTREGMAASIRAEIHRLGRTVAKTGDRTARGASNFRASEMQLDVQVPGGTFSLRTIVLWLRDQLRLPEPGVMTEVRCPFPSIARASTTPTPSASAAIAGRTADKSEADCDPNHLSVEIVVLDPDGRGSMQRLVRNSERLDQIAKSVAQVVAFHFTPALLGNAMLKDANDSLHQCRAPDFREAKRAFVRAVEQSERVLGFAERVTKSRDDDLWEQGKLGLVSVLSSEADEAGTDTERAPKLRSDAKDIADEIVGKRPRSTLARVALANALLWLNQFDEASAALVIAEQYEPNNVEVLANRANFYYYKESYEEAIKQNRRALERGAQLPVLYENLGYSLLKAKRADEAVHAFKEAARLDPERRDWAGLGEALRQGKHLREAMNALERAISERPCEDAAYLAMARASLETGQPKNTLIYLDRLRKAQGNPNLRWAELYQVEAKALVELKRRKEANASYEKASELLNTGLAFDTADVAASIYQEHSDMIYYSDMPKQERLEKAIQILLKGIEANQDRKDRKPLLAQLQSNLGFARSEQGKDAEAERELLKALQFDPDYVTAHSNLAYVRERLKHDDDALSSANRALELDAKDSVASCVKAKILKRRNQPKESSDAARRATERNGTACP